MQGMCMVSNLGTGYGDTFPERWPSIPIPPQPVYEPAISREEFEALRREIEELKKLLRAAKDFDEATGQPDCEMDEKVELIKRVAELVGVDLEDLFS